MKRQTACVGAALVLLVTCVSALRRTDIVKGTETPDSETWGLAWVTVNGDQKCTALFMNPNWALTAAHCLDGRQTSSLGVCPFGKSLANPYGQTCRDVDRTAVHPTFKPGVLNPDEKGLDVALLHVNQPVDLPYDDTRRRLYAGTLESLVGNTVTCYGNGTNVKRYGERASVSELDMRHADLSVSTKTKWGFRMPTNAQGQITTSGDSGGPCLIVDAIGHAVVGVTSQRQLVGDELDFTISAVTSGAPGFREWVRDTIYPDRRVTPRLPTPGVEMVGITDGNGRLWHVLRRSVDGIYYPPQNLSATLGTATAMSHVAVSQDAARRLHLVTVSADGRSLSHALRTETNWSVLGDVKAEAGDLPPLAQVSTAAGAELHVLALRRDGQLAHTIRHSDGHWDRFGDVLASATNPGRVIRVASALEPSSGELHVFVINSSWQISHTIRSPRGTWTRFEPISIGASSGRIYDLGATVSTDISPSGAPDSALHLIWTTGQIVWHRVRARTTRGFRSRPTFTWSVPTNLTATAGTPAYSDFRGQDPGDIIRVAVSGPQGRLQIWAATQFGHLWWTRQLTATAWRPFENAEGESDAGTMPLVDLAVTTAGAFRTPTRIVVPANSLWFDTGIDLIQGEPWTIAAMGTWSNAGAPTVGPQGFSGYLYPNTLLGTAPLGSLIGRIGSTMFPVGTSLEGGVPFSGRLFLSINDTAETFGDNQGAVTVILR